MFFRPLHTPRIYVACLTSYNHGCLHGRWIDSDQDLEDILAEIRAMLDSSPFEDSEEHDATGVSLIHFHRY